ncbi:MAG: Uma2 family endonuclease [Defluviitaleaceae bacterium]|nr:Uma2 family endonuclease [Defluviitaleaceae bacterium]MCL2835193.1 Uma2 family endonuclease [Defluviitaleaceae bacterium]
MSEPALKYDDYQYEKLNGKITAMAPSPNVNHTKSAINIFKIFDRYLEGKPCEVFSEGYDVHLSESDYVIPDMMVVCNKDIIKYDGIYGAPDLVVEVLSPGTSRKDRGYKKNLYEKHGVTEFWLVSTEMRSIEVYLLTNGRYELDDVYTVFPESLIKRMREEGKTEFVTEFNPAIFPELIIKLDEVFKDLIN